MLGFRNLSKCVGRIPLRPKLQRTCSVTTSQYSSCLTNKQDTRCKISNNQLCNSQTIHTQECRLFRTSSRYDCEARAIVVPPFAESITEGDIRWIKAVGDFVKEDETVAEVETDKTSVPVNSPCSGTVVEILVEDGSTVNPGAKICTVKPGEGGSAPPPPKPAAEAAPVAAATPSPTPSTPAPSPASAPPPPPVPSKVPISSIPVASIKHSSSLQKAQVKLPPDDYTKEITGTRTEQRVKMSRMRLRIAQRLKDAQNSAAMLTTFNEVDMSNIMELRKSVGEAFLKKNGFKLGFMSAFVKASAYALQELPVVNAVIDANEIVYRDYVDLSVAVATPKGLVVPVIRNVGGMNYLDIEKAIIKLGEKAKSGSLAVEDMDGGTFTISNGGVFGSMFGTPIINPPQSAILGMHGIFDRPVARNGQVVIRPMMYVALTYDHRLVDGREAVTFLKKIKTSVEDPRTMLCGL